MINYKYLGLFLLFISFIALLVLFIIVFLRKPKRTPKPKHTPKHTPTPKSNLKSNITPKSESLSPNRVSFAEPLVKQENNDDFISSQQFQGQKPNYIFKTDHLGTGYYKDHEQKVDIESILSSENNSEMDIDWKNDNFVNVKSKDGLIKRIPEVSAPIFGNPSLIGKSSDGTNISNMFGKTVRKN